MEVAGTVLEQNGDPGSSDVKSRAALIYTALIDRGAVSTIMLELYTRKRIANFGQNSFQERLEMLKR